MSEWETIIRHRAEANEERKREYIRWTAAGLASIAAFSGLLLQRVADSNFGSHQYLSLITLLVTSYLIIEMAWQIIAEKIAQTVYMFVGIPPPGNVWDLVIDPTDVAGMPVFSIFWEFVVNFAITAVVAFGGLAVSSPASGYFNLLAGLRFVSVALLFGLFWIARSEGKRKTSSPSVKTEKALSRVTSQRGRIATFLGTKVFGVVYYGIQIWIALVAFLSIATLSLAAIQIIVLIVGTMGIAKWIWRVTWPLVNHYARLMGGFQRLHDRLLSGNYAGPDAVLADFKSALTGSRTTSPPDTRGA